MLVTLTPEFISSQLVCPPGQRRIEYVDRGSNGGGGLGLYVEVRATSPGTGTYYLRYKNKNQKSCHQKIGRTTEISLADARKESKRLKAEIVLLGADPRRAALAKKEVPTFSQFMSTSYFPYAEVHKRSWRRDEQLWRVHIEGTLGEKRVDQLTRRQIQSLHMAKAEQGLAASSANHVAKLIRRALNLAIEWGLLEKNPAARIPMLFEDNQKERYLTDTELERLLHVLRTDRNVAVCQIIMFLLSTGCRLNEALSAKWVDVDLERRVFVVRASNSKSKRVRSVPLNDSAIDVLKSLATRDVGGALFVSPRSKQAFTTIAKQFQRIRKAAGLPDFRIHDARHFFASALVSSGRTLYETQQILGHSTPVVTQRYAHLSTRALQEAASTASARLTGGAKSPE